MLRPGSPPPCRRNTCHCTFGPPPLSRTPMTNLRLAYCLLPTAALCATAGFTATDAQAPGVWRITDTSRVVDLSIASSGGVSIGAYLAGANWMLAELLKFMRDHPELRAVFRLPKYRIAAMSGASAGNVNALLTALQACDAGPARPAEQSALWDVWMQVGVEQLLPGRNSDPALELGLLDRGYFNTVLFDRMKADFERPPDPSCRIPIVATMSKLLPSLLSLNPLMAAKVQRFVTSYSLEAQGSSNGDGMRLVVRPAASLVRLDTALGKQVSLVTKADDGNALDLANLFLLLKASASVSYLFEPVELEYCDATEAVIGGGCRAGGTGTAAVQKARFVDGGAIDNAPLFAAIRLMELQDSLRGPRDGDRPSRGTLLVTYDVRRRSPRDTSSATAPTLPGSVGCGAGRYQERCGGIGSMAQFLGGLLATGGQFELQWLARLRARDASLRNLDVELTTRQAALAGEHLMNASAFLARPLREFDFHVGVYDLLHFAASRVLCVPEHRRPLDTTPVNQCVIDTIRGLVDRVPLSCQSSLVVDLLLRREYGIESSEALRERQLRETAHCDDTSTDSRERAFAYRSLFAAVTAVAEGTAGGCPRSGPVVGALCAEGTLQVLRELKKDAWFRDYVRRQADRCDQALSTAPDSARARVAAECFANRDFDSMLDNPERVLFTLVRRLLDRAQWLEEEIERKQDSRSAGLGWDVLTQVTNLVARSALLSEETGLVVFPTVVPERRNAWRILSGLLFPQEVGLEALSNGWSYYWHPVEYRWKSGIALSATWGRMENAFPVFPDSLRSGRRSRLTASIRAAYRPVLRGNILLTAVSAGIQYVHPSPGDVDARPWSSQAFSPELRANLLWDRLAVTVTRNPGYGALQDRHRLRASVSVMDPGGIAYWLFRTAWLR